MRYLFALSLALAASTAQAGNFPLTHPDQIGWQDAPGELGVQVILLAGHPEQEGLYKMRVKFPPGVMTPPHVHDQDRHITVISGIWWVVEGAVEDPETLIPVPAGSAMIHPKGAVHFDGAKETEAIVEITGLGPVQTTFLNAAP